MLKSCKFSTIGQGLHISIRLVGNERKVGGKRREDGTEVKGEICE